MRHELEERFETEWFGATEYQRMRYKIERLEMFKQYIELEYEFHPPLAPDIRGENDD